MTARHKQQVSPVAPISELVYITPQGSRGYLALQDSRGAIYPLQENPSLEGARIHSMRDNYLLILQNTEIITDIQRRVFQSGHKSLEQLFHACVKHLKKPIIEAAFNGHVDITKLV